MRDRAPIERFVDRLSARDVDAVTAMSAPYARVVMPYRTPGFPTEMSGDEQIREALTILDVYEHAPFAVRLLAIGSEAGSDRH
ncbi:hypothetical protein [Nocardia pseudobrasiliensis]|uniref:hypothetical protein n=1 Tax=Nocardia pseudobrasiliensis TaxID=45979 RepID=UPI0008349FA3|nr:hypothetical protein [Nocardia pseudobrasiliensis]